MMNHSEMELRHVRYFHAVVTHGGFSAAARALRVAQPAVSQAVKDLESELGVRLLARNTRSVRKTAAGEVFAGHAVALLERAAEAAEATRRAARGEAGTLRLAFLGSATSPFLPELVREYRRRFPSVNLRLHEMTPAQQAAAFSERRIDLGFSRRFGPEGRDLGLAEERIYDDRLVLVLPVGHRLAKGEPPALRDCATEPFVVFHREGAPRLYDATLALCHRAGFVPRVVAEPEHMATLITQVEAETGLALVPGCVRNLASRAVVFRAPKPAGTAISLVLARRKDEDSPTAVAFRDLVRERLVSIRRQMEPAAKDG